MFDNLANTAKKYLPFLKRDTRNRQLMLSLYPTRYSHLQWERSEKTGLVVVNVDDYPMKRWDKFIGKMFKIPTEHRIEMSDELSSLVWEMCDGKHTVGAISSHIAKEYKLTVRQAEVSVLAFLNTLQSKQLIGIPSSQAQILKEGANKPAPTGPKGNNRFYASRKHR